MTDDGLTAFSARRRLRSTLRRIRENLGLTQNQVAAELDWSISKFTRIEGGTVSIGASDLLALCVFYGVGPSVQEQLLHYRERAKGRSWWHPYKAVMPASMATLVDLESDAAALRMLATTEIPHLFQTDEYAHASVTAQFGPVPSDETTSRTALRLARQSVLTRPDAPQVTLLLDESVLYRAVADATVMARQLLRLAEMSRRPNTDLRIYPFEAGAYGYPGGLVLIEHRAVEDGVTLYYDTVEDATTVEDPTEVRRHLAGFEALWDKALDRNRTNHLLHHVATQYAESGHTRPWL